VTRIERAELPRRLAAAGTGSVGFALSGVIVLDTVGSAAQTGAQVLTWLAVLCVCFLLPYALIVAELGAAFPHEGGPYTWVRLAFGRPAAALGALLYWIANPIWLGGTLTVVALSVVESYFVELGRVRYPIALAVIWLVAGGALLGPRARRCSSAVGAALRLVLLAFVGLSAVLYGIAHGIHGGSVSELRPTSGALVIAVPVLVFGLLGLELPSAAGLGAGHARAIPRAILGASFATALAYLLPVLALVVVLPIGQLSSIGGFVEATRTLCTVYGGSVDAQGVAHLSGAGSLLGDIAAIGFIGTLLTGGATWLRGANGVLAVAAADGSAPPVLARRTRADVPIAAGILSGAVATITMALAYELASGRLARYFGAMLGLGISTVLLSYLLVFPSLLRLRRTQPDVARPFIVPGGRPGAWACTLLTTAIALFAALELIYPGLGLAHPDTVLPGSFEGLRSRYELSMAVPLAALALLGALSFASGRRAAVSDA
jgi:amino acid transporter